MASVKTGGAYEGGWSRGAHYFGRRIEWGYERRTFMSEFESIHPAKHRFGFRIGSWSIMIKGGRVS